MEISEIKTETPLMEACKVEENTNEIEINVPLDIKEENLDEKGNIENILNLVPVKQENDELDEHSSYVENLDSLVISKTESLLEVKEEYDENSSLSTGTEPSSLPLEPETILQQEINIKHESENNQDEYQNEQNYFLEEREIKVEPDVHNNVIAKNIINTHSVGNSKVDSTKTLVMEILPLGMSLDKFSKITTNPEQILPNDGPSDEFNTFDSPFQLNSITSDMLPLDQSFCLLKEKKSPNTTELIPCPQCPKMCKKTRLKYHLQLHDSIERRAMAVLKGLQTKALNKKKTMRDIEEECGMGDFKCMYCGKEYHMKKSFLRHQRNCSANEELAKEEFKCPFCSKSYQSQRHMAGHRRICSKKLQVVVKEETPSIVSDVKKIGEYLCPCGKAFYRRSRMETCLRSHNMESEMKACVSCVACTKQFKDKAALAAHKKTQHIKKRYPCKFCPTDYYTLKQLFKHLRKHQKVQLMEYKIISEVVSGKQELNCFMCKKTYNELSELKSHVLGDHKEPYNCPHCNKKFPNIIEFASHTKTSHPEVEGQSVLDVLEALSKLARSWKCEECELQFDQPEKLALHQAEQHTQAIKSEAMTPQFQCNDCSRVFMSLKQLSTHRRMIHNNHDKTKEDVKEERDRYLMCVHCRKICKNIDILTSHMRLHSLERRYVCKYCDFRFATHGKRKEHATIHTGDLKFVCFICEYRCSSENRLRLHKKSSKHLSMKNSLLTSVALPSSSVDAKPSCSVVKEEKSVTCESKSSDSDDPIACNICGEMFPSESKMLDHKQTHPFIEFPNDDQPTRIFFK